MLMKDYIEQGAKKAGSLTALGVMLGLSQPRMSHVKGGKEKLPAQALVQLTDYIGADLKAVIAANELVREKDESKRAFWSPFVEHAKAAGIALSIGLVTNLVTPSPSNASEHTNEESASLYYVKLAMMMARLKQRILIRVWGFRQIVMKDGFETMQAAF